MDDEFNLINMRGRIYDPKIARFMSPDPLVSAPNSGNGYDRYGYALNNPMKYTDPSGLMTPLSDMWLSLQGCGDSIGFFNYVNSLFADRASDIWRKTHEKRT